MSPDQDRWRQDLRRALAVAMERKRLQRYDPFELGTLQDMAFRIWTNSRRISEVQQVALSNLLRDLADAIETRWHR
jgi:hypothetical protein